MARTTRQQDWAYTVKSCGTVDRRFVIDPVKLSPNGVYYMA